MISLSLMAVESIESCVYIEGRDGRTNLALFFKPSIAEGCASGEEHFCVTTNQSYMERAQRRTTASAGIMFGGKAKQLPA